MDRKTKILFQVFVIIVLVVMSVAYARFYVLRDYVITSEVACDPTSEACFVRHCEEDCEEEVSYYKIQQVHAAVLPLCDPHQGECPELVCSETPTCSQTFCNETTVSAGEECSSLPEVVEEERGEAVTTPIELPGNSAE